MIIYFDIMSQPYRENILKLNGHCTDFQAFKLVRIKILRNCKLSYLSIDNKMKIAKCRQSLSYLYLLYRLLEPMVIRRSLQALTPARTRPTLM